MITDEYANAAQAAVILGVERRTIASWIKEGRLTAEEVGLEVLIRRGQLTQVYKSPRGRRPKRTT